MSTRYLVAALLMASACAAQADVLPTVQGSDSANLVKSLFDKASANQSGEVNLSSAPAQGTYVVGTSNAVMATMLGSSFSALKLAIKGDQTAATVGTVTTPSTGSVSAPVADVVPAPAAGTVAAPSTGTVTVPEIAELAPVLGEAPNDTVTAPAAGGAVTSPEGPITVAPLADAPVALAEGDVPEPSSIALMMVGMLGAAAIGRRRAR